MSGRSGFVRKKKIESAATRLAKDRGSTIKAEETQGPSSPTQLSSNDPQSPISQLSDGGSSHNATTEIQPPPIYNGLSSGVGYAVTQTPIIDKNFRTHIEKSKLRSNIEKKSDDFRHGVSEVFKGLGISNKTPEIRSPGVVEQQKFTEAGTILKLQPSPDTKNALEITPEKGTEKSPETRRGPKVALTPRKQLKDAAQSPGPPPSLKLPPLPVLDFNRWVGYGNAVQPWDKLRKDPELWDSNADTLIFLCTPDTSTSFNMNPSFRLSSNIIESSGSTFLQEMLQRGSTDKALWSRAALPQAAYFDRQRRVASSDPNDSAYGFDGQVSYELYFPPPLSLSKSEALRHKVATRNLFAMLNGASLVGTTMYQALCDLRERVENYMPDGVDAAGMVIEYLIKKGLDDMRRNPSTAVAILCWSEKDSVQWEDGWQEAFVHCSGLMGQLKEAPDYHQIPAKTMACLEISSLECQLRVQKAEMRLADFDLLDMWEPAENSSNIALAAFDRFRTFLINFYAKQLGKWPPAPKLGSDQWLNRLYAQRMARDFEALYDHLVNREISWGSPEEPSGRKWNMIERNCVFDPDTKEFPITKMLAHFDDQLCYPHIPHPYPFVPDESIAADLREMCSTLSRKNDLSGEDKMAERKAALAYSDATNIYLPNYTMLKNELVTSFIQFEKEDYAGFENVHDARKGRWIMIYGVLQVLISISVDVPGLRYTDGCEYHLSAILAERDQPHPPDYPSVSSTDTESGIRTPTLTNDSVTLCDIHHHENSPRPMALGAVFDANNYEEIVSRSITPIAMYGTNNLRDSPQSMGSRDTPEILHYGSIPSRTEASSTKELHDLSEWPLPLQRRTGVRHNRTANVHIRDWNVNH